MHNNNIDEIATEFEEMNPIAAFEFIHAIACVYGGNNGIDIAKLTLMGEWLKTMIEEEVTPRFEHGCSSCIFLGGYRPPVNYKYEPYYDLYWCPMGGIQTILARYGNAGHEYMSGSPLMKKVIEARPFWPTHEGYRRALAKGLTVPEPR